MEIRDASQVSRALLHPVCSNRLLGPLSKTATTDSSQQLYTEGLFSSPSLSFSPWIRAYFQIASFPFFCVLFYACYLRNQSLPLWTYRKRSLTVKGATFFGRQVFPIIRSQRQLGLLDGSIPSPPQMIEERSTRKEDTTTKTLVKNPAKTRYVQLLFLPLDRGNKSQLDQPLLDPLTYDRLNLWSRLMKPKRILFWLSLLRVTLFSGRPRGEREGWTQGKKYCANRRGSS